MPDSKFFFTLIGLCIAIFAIYITPFKSNTSESFLLGSALSKRTSYETIGSKECKARSLTPMEEASYKNNNLHFIQNPNLESALAPRFNNVYYGAQIQYKKPHYNNMAVPSDSRALGDMVKEDYTSNCNNTSNNSIHTLLNKNNANDNTDNNFPLSDMFNFQSDDLSNCLIVDRHIYSNLKQRGQGEACPVRGDEAVSGMQPIGMTSRKPNNLKLGYMAAISDKPSENTLKIAELKGDTLSSINGGITASLSKS